MDFQLITLILFAVFGGIALFFRLNYDFNQGSIQYGNKNDADTHKKASKNFRLQFVFGFTSFLFLIISIVIGVFKTM